MARTGRPTRQIPATRPFATFANDLVALRVDAELTGKELAKAARCASSVISAATTGLSLPTEVTLVAYVRACGGDQNVVDAWLARRVFELTRAASQAGNAVPPAALTVVETPRPDVKSAPAVADFPSGIPTSSTTGRLVEFRTRPPRDDAHHGDPRFNPDDPTSVTTRAELAESLNKLRHGMSYLQLEKAARRNGDHLSRSTIGDALSGQRTPSLRTLEALLAACGLSGRAQTPWVTALERVATESLPRPPRAIRVADAGVRTIGIHERPLDEVVRPGSDLPDVPAYVPRDIDPAVRQWQAEAATRGGALLLVGPSGAGKTRTLYEAVRAAFPARWLFQPADLAELQDFASAPTPGAVVWLDDLAHYIGLDAATVRRLLHGKCVVLGAVWPQRYQEWTVLPRPGQTDTHARERGILEQVTVMTLSVELTADELARAGKVAGGDERLAVALWCTDAEAFQTLIGGSELVRRWISAPAAEKALITAAVDAHRMGIKGPLTADLLRAAAAGYLSPTELAQLDGDWLTPALAYTTSAVRGGVRVMVPVGSGIGTVIGYHVADYLVRYAEIVRGVAAPPAEAWTAYAAGLLDAGDMVRAARAAQERALLQHAEALLRAATLGRSSDARAALAELLRVQDRGDEAERVRWRGLNADGTTAA